MRTTTVRPFRRFSTFTLVPKGSERCAAVRAVGSQRSPEAVLLVMAYHEARPVWASACAWNVRSETATRVAAARLVAEKIMSPKSPFQFRTGFKGCSKGATIRPWQEKFRRGGTTFALVRYAPPSSAAPPAAETSKGPALRPAPLNLLARS